jgi:NAD(P)-dependent dehydrogenase (short-subunit alcohol dehydrogenase family)
LLEVGSDIVFFLLFSGATADLLTHNRFITTTMVDNGTSKRAILVTGATGKQGGATIDALINAGAPNTHILMAVTRDPASTTAKKLESRGVVLVQGDLDNCPAIFARAKAALGGGKSAKIWGVFSVQVLHFSFSFLISIYEL